MGKGDKDRDRCARIVGSSAARDCDLPTPPLHQLFHDPQADSRAEIPLGGEEGLKYPRKMFSLDPGPIILN